MQAGYGGEELEDCPDCAPCRYCDGTGKVGLPLGVLLEKLFPFSAQQIERLNFQLAEQKALNADKAKTIAAYCRIASLDKWRVRKLVDAIDRYLSEDGYRDASSILTNARAEAVNAKPGAEITTKPLTDDELDNKRFPTGPLRKYGLNVPDGDTDREYCVGYNHGLVLAEAVIEELVNSKPQMENKLSTPAE